MNDDDVRKLKQFADDLMSKINNTAEAMDYINCLFQSISSEIVRIADKVETWENAIEREAGLRLITPVVRMVGSLLVATSHPSMYLDYIKFCKDPAVIKFFNFAEKVLSMVPPPPDATVCFVDFPEEVKEVLEREPVEDKPKKWRLN